MRDVRATYRDATSITFHVHGQSHGGSPGDFDAFRGHPGIRLHMDEPLNKTFTDMATADVLITAPSSFSYAAALISEGAVWAPVPWWHTYPSHWRTVSRSSGNATEKGACLPAEERPASTSWERHSRTFRHLTKKLDSYPKVDYHASKSTQKLF